MEGGPFSIGGVHIPWVESYGIWTPGSIFNGGPYSISHRQALDHLKIDHPIIEEIILYMTFLRPLNRK